MYTYDIREFLNYMIISKDKSFSMEYTFYDGKELDNTLNNTYLSLCLEIMVIIFLKPIKIKFNI